MRYLTMIEVLSLHRQIMHQSGGMPSLRDLAALESALAQPKQTFASQDLYPTIVEKAAILGFTIILNHPFVDGNKRIGHAAIEEFLKLNGFEIKAGVDEQEKIILEVASGKVKREEFTNWLKLHLVKRAS
jgi:death-on-curing protein